jgi:histidinol dehydrogenase
MKLSLINGQASAEAVLARRDLLTMDSLPESAVERTHQLFGEGVTPAQSVVRILEDVRHNGDSAVRYYARLLDGVELGELRVDEEQFKKARVQVPTALRNALEVAAARVTEYHRTSLREGWIDRDKGLGEVVRPLQRVGLYAPGGTAAYPSTVLMTAIPARVAGVAEVVLATPRRCEEPLNPAVLVAAEIAGVDVVYQVGGATAIAAMAFGTESIPKVDKICGPGNIFVAYAKKLVQGQVDIDGLFGPTETVIIADDTANPSFCAADLIAQAEHDPMATAILVTNSRELIERVELELDHQLVALPRGETARSALERQGRVVLVRDIAEAVDLANSIAPEHLCLIIADPWVWVDRVKNAGGLFLGEYSPEVMGDYVAGPSHVMPTGGTARFTSALGVHHFLRTMPVVGLDQREFQRLGPSAIQIAEAEGLSGHLSAIQIRLDSLSQT